MEDLAVTSETRPQQQPRDGKSKRQVNWKAMLGNRKNNNGNPSNRTSTSDFEERPPKKPDKWSMGMLNDPETEEVPGSILLLSEVSQYNEPLGLYNAPARTSTSSLPSPYLIPSQRSSFSRRRPLVPEKKRTGDGKIILEPQPDDSLNDPLNWRVWRRDLALGSLGFYCMVGGGMTPILAAGFDEVANDFGIPEPRVALSTGMYMLGLGVGSAVLAPTAILFGKRPVYLASAICFILTSIWCALSPDFVSLVVARVFMGIAVSSVECLPSATVAEIFFLHEKAYRLGIYTLLLLGGKNLVPLVSAAIIQELHWRWVFWIVAMIVGLGFCLLYLFVPETFWDRTPRPRKHASGLRRFSSSRLRANSLGANGIANGGPTHKESEKDGVEAANIGRAEKKVAQRKAHFATIAGDDAGASGSDGQFALATSPSEKMDEDQHGTIDAAGATGSPIDRQESVPSVQLPERVLAADYINPNNASLVENNAENLPQTLSLSATMSDTENQLVTVTSPPTNRYTDDRRGQPPVSFLEQLRPYSGRLTKESWLRVAVRPFILYTYPSILWSALVYSLSIGWLIVLSESVSTIYENRASYNFDSLHTGLIYISPFIGGILGTAVAGKVSDQVVRYLARKNGGIYEPEFRLVMGVPIAIFTTIGLMGYGWSAAERDLWIVPTIFFGFISFGCSLGSTTAITFAVDSYRQYAGEALVTLNFSKNIFHGLVFSLFFNKWLDADGSRTVFICIGAIQMACLLTTVPMYIYGKRARMWTVRMNRMEKF